MSAITDSQRTNRFQPLGESGAASAYPGISTDANHTRPQGTTTPSGVNLENRANSRRKTEPNRTVPNRLDLGGGAPIQSNRRSAAQVLQSRYAQLDKEVASQRSVHIKFAQTVDNFVAQTIPEERAAAHELAKTFLTFLSTHLYATTNGTVFVPTRAKSKESSSSSGPEAAPKSVSFADIARGPIGKATFPWQQGTKSAAPPSGGTRTPASTKGASSAESSSSRATNRRTDKRILVTVQEAALLTRPEPYALRHAICHEISGLSIHHVPAITPTKTGWAISPLNNQIRETLMLPDNVQTLLRIFNAVQVRLPENWINYAVPGVPSGIHNLAGARIPLSPALITEEVVAQARAQPVSVRPSRNGADAEGKTTWIASFLAPVRIFTLFGVSSQSRLITKRAAIVPHNPGCQAWCNSAKCTRSPRCVICSDRIEGHEGASGLNCKKNPRCANCHGPFPASHRQCPAAPRRERGVLIRPTKKELGDIRRHGNNFSTKERTPVAKELTGNETTGTTRAAKTGPPAPPPRAKRGLTISAHERTGSQASSSQAGPPQSSSAGSSDTPAAVPVRPRSTRNASIRPDLNEARMSQASVQPPYEVSDDEEEDEDDDSEPEGFVDANHQLEDTQPEHDTDTDMNA